MLNSIPWLVSRCEIYKLHQLRLELQPGSFSQGALLERAVPIDSHSNSSSLADGEGGWDGWDDESVHLDLDKCRDSDGDVAECGSYELDGEPCA